MTSGKVKKPPPSPLQKTTVIKYILALADPANDRLDEAQVALAAGISERSARRYKNLPGFWDAYQEEVRRIHRRDFGRVYRAVVEDALGFNENLRGGAQDRFFKLGGHFPAARTEITGAGGGPLTWQQAQELPEMDRREAKEILGRALGITGGEAGDAAGR